MIMMMVMVVEVVMVLVVEMVVVMMMVGVVTMMMMSERMWGRKIELSPQQLFLQTL